MTSWRELDEAIQAEGGVTPCQSAPDLFFEFEDGGQNSYMYARRLCADCPVRALCLDYALTSEQGFGVWGGTSPHDRRRMLRGGGLVA